MVRAIFRTGIAFMAFVCIASFSARAADMPPAKIDWKACDKEMKEFACKGSDKQIWECLEKHDEKLSESCDKQHEKGDKLFAK